MVCTSNGSLAGVIFSSKLQVADFDDTIILKSGSHSYTTAVLKLVYLILYVELLQEQMYLAW